MIFFKYSAALLKCCSKLAKFEMSLSCTDAESIGQVQRESRMTNITPKLNVKDSVMWDRNSEWFLKSKYISREETKKKVS